MASEHAVWRRNSVVRAEGTIVQLNKYVERKVEATDASKLTRFFGVWHPEREDNVCEQFEETGSCTPKHCCKMHQWDKTSCPFRR